MDRKTAVATTCALLAGLAIAGCGDSPGAGTGSEARSTLARVATPDVSSGAAAQLAADNRGFAVDLHQALRARTGNLVYSPASISIALAMLYGGAVGTTASEIATALHFGLTPDRLHPAFNALDLALEAPPAAPAGFQLSLTNAVWGQQDYHFLSTYLDLLAQNYGAGMRLVDFGTPEPARQQINRWVADNTQQKITELIPAGAIVPDTRLVLTNAVYFKGAWKIPYTAADYWLFHAPDGDVSVRAMGRTDSIPIWSGVGFTAAAFSYIGDTTSMVVIVPDAGTFDAFEQGLTGDGLGAILDGQSGGAPGGSVTLPFFKFATKIDLVDTLKALGMRAAFNPGQADLSAIDGTHDLYVSDVIHQATIAVDEKGTEASGATAVVLTHTIGSRNFLAVDRPFLFVIRDDATDAILFQGRVLDPSK